MNLYKSFRELRSRGLLNWKVKSALRRAELISKKRKAAKAATAPVAQTGFHNYNGVNANPPARLYKGDCLVEMAKIPDGSVDCIISDLPFSTTLLDWDKAIHADKMWAEFRRIAKPEAPIVLFAVQPYTSALMMSNDSMFREILVWNKSRAANFPQANNRHLKKHEDILVFSKLPANYAGGKPTMTFHPQGVTKLSSPIYHPKRNKRVLGHTIGGDYYQTNTNYPGTVLDFESVPSCKMVHPTQKPVALIEYLVRTYSHPGGVLLDATMGSGTTGVAALNCGRRFVGIERDESYFSIAASRIAGAGALDLAIAA